MDDHPLDYLLDSLSTRRLQFSEDSSLLGHSVSRFIVLHPAKSLVVH